MRKLVTGICAKCGDEKVVNVNKLTKQPICQRCYRRFFSPKRTCGYCGEKRRDVFNYRQGQQPACSKCYKKYLQPKLACSICGHEHVVAAYDHERRPICSSCLRTGPNAQRCSLCGQKRAVNSYTADGQPVCHLCHRGFINLKVCAQCSKQKSVAKKRPDGTYLCRACVEENSKGNCPRCNNFRSLANRVDGQLVCRLCKWESQTAECRTCRKPRPIVAKGQCGNCYHIAREKRAVERIRAMAIGTIIYRKTTKERGKVIGLRQPARYRGRKRFTKAEIIVRIISGTTPGNHFWPAIECAPIRHDHHYKPLEQEATT